LCDLTSMGHLLGYARVITADQHPRLQIGALKRVCHRVVTETACGSASGRPVLDQVLHQLRPGDPSMSTCGEADRAADSLS
jgi:DNA invertase Pin-like site-specific DNA recombinase